MHALLDHLLDVGFEYAPRPIGINGAVETVSFVEGETPGEPATEWAGEDVLTSVGRLLRRYHDAAASFTPPGWARWQSTSIPTTGSLVCHTDLCLGNVVFRERRAVGIIDFDFAHPADPIWDLAMAAWHWLPLSRDAMGRAVPASEWPARLRLLVDAYGVAGQQRRGVVFVLADLIGRMRDSRLNDPQAVDRFNTSLRALERHRPAMLDVLQ